MVDVAIQLWEKACERLKSFYSLQMYELWIKRLKALSYEGNTLTLEVWDTFSQIWLQSNYQSVIEETLREITGEGVSICFVLTSADKAEVSKEELEEKVEEVSAKTEESILLKKNVSNSQERIAPVYSQQNTERLSSSKSWADINFTPNPKYTFSTFVVGNNSNLAHASAMAVARKPGKTYNPLFIYGGVGLGKTHLLHAIANSVLENKKDLKVVYVTLEKVMNEYVDAVKSGRFARFRNKYRTVDVLLVDDIQFLARKEGLQEEFFHTFNALYEAKKQIVMTSDRPVGEIKELEERLVSRFNWGMVADLQPPNVEVRKAILDSKASDMDVHLPNDVSEFLAANIRANVRELQGALIRLASVIRLGLPINGMAPGWNIRTAEIALQDILRRQLDQLPTAERIQKAVAGFYDIRTGDIIGKRRTGNIAFARQVAMYLTRSMLKMPYIAIGEAFGGRDHGTVMHACKVVQDRMDIDSKVRADILQLEREMKGE